MEISSPNFTSTSFMKNLNLIYIIILVGMMLFGSVILFTTDSWESTMPNSEDGFLIIVPLLTFIGVVLGRVIYKRKLDGLANKESLRSKLTGYQTALIIKFVLVEVPFTIGIVAALMTGNIFYLMISGTLVMYFITLKPTRSKVKKDLNLSTAMGLQFNDRNTVVN